MKDLIGRIIKEQNEGLKERFVKNMRSLEYVVQSNVNSDLINEIGLFDIEFQERFSQIRATAKVISWCEDSDIDELHKQLKRVEYEMYRLFNNLEFTKNGKLDKVNGDSYLMVIPWKVNWDGESGDIFMEFDIIQDDYRTE
jgi:hypothetical protein